MYMYACAFLCIHGTCSSMSGIVVMTAFQDFFKLRDVSVNGTNSSSGCSPGSTQSEFMVVRCWGKKKKKKKRKKNIYIYIYVFYINIIIIIILIRNTTLNSC